MQTEPHGDASRIPPIRYLLVAWILVLSAIAFLDRTNISIAGVKIGQEFHIDNPHLGWVFSAFLVGYAAFQIPGGVLARRFGPRGVLALGLAWWGVFTALTALVPPQAAGALMVLILIRMALGAGEAVMYPAANQFVERWFPMWERGKANGIVFGGVGLGSAIAPPLLTAIMLRYGWQASFWFCAALGLAAGGVWYVAARNTPEVHPWVGAEELAMIARGRGDRRDGMALAMGGTAGKTPVPWRRIFTSRSILAITGSYFTYGYVSWIFFSWFYIYLSEVRGLSLRSSAVYSIFPFAAMSAGSLLGGLLSDWLARRFSERAGRCFLPAFALALTALLLTAGSRVHQAQAASLILAGGAGALYLSQSCFWSVTSNFAGTFTGVVSGAMNMGCQIGAAVTASLTPLIAARFGWQASFSTATALAILGAAAWLLVDPDARLDPGTPGRERIFSTGWAENQTTATATLTSQEEQRR
jgi:MFS transporter, ACS family, glucarate transporter